MGASARSPEYVAWINQHEMTAKLVTKVIPYHEARTPSTAGFWEDRCPAFPSPETALWAAVIQQALHDATSPTVRTRAGGAAGVPATAERNAARAWLISCSQDFKEVAYLAGLDPLALLERSRDIARRGWHRRIDPLLPSPFRLRRTALCRRLYRAASRS
jgi:hypothetical protein